MRILLFQMSTGLAENFNKLIIDFMSVIPNLVKALIIFIVGYLIAKIVAKIIKRALKLIGVDKLGDKLNAIDLVQDNNIEIVPSTVFSKIC